MLTSRKKKDATNMGGVKWWQSSEKRVRDGFLDAT